MSPSLLPRNIPLFWESHKTHPFDGQPRIISLSDTFGHMKERGVKRCGNGSKKVFVCLKRRMIRAKNGPLLLVRTCCR